jgi:hypothetical protein
VRAECRAAAVAATERTDRAVGGHDLEPDRERPREECEHAPGALVITTAVAVPAVVGLLALLAPKQ